MHGAFLLAFVKVETIISTCQAIGYLWGMEKNKEMKQPIETLLTELAVLENDLKYARLECEDAEKELFEAQNSWILACAKQSKLLTQIETIKTQIAQANENS